MAREIITQSGAVAYRTKLMTDAALVNRFARCLSHNRRFVDVAVQASTTAKSPSWYVTFRPANTERQGEMLLSQWNRRADKAAAEGMEYVFCADTDHAGDYWCFNPISGETYQVSCFRCTCADYHYRCAKAGIQCKHQHAWELQSRAGLLNRREALAA